MSSFDELMKKDLQDRIDSMNEMERKSRKAQDMLDDAGIER
jgi:hypothetical protein